MTGKRSPYYGELQIAKQPSEVRKIWHTRNDELDDLPTWRWSFDYETDVDVVEQRELLEKIIESSRINKREQLVLRMLTVEDYTLEEIGQVLGVSKERIRQMHGQIIRKLRRAQWQHTGVAPWNINKEVTTWSHYKWQQQQSRKIQ